MRNGSSTKSIANGSSARAHASASRADVSAPLKSTANPGVAPRPLRAAATRSTSRSSGKPPTLILAPWYPASRYPRNSASTASGSVAGP